MFKLLLRLLTLIFIIVYIYSLNYKVTYYPLKKITYYEIEIKGAVEEEKIVKLAKGQKIADALKLIKLKKNADLSSISLLQPLYHKQIINIPYQVETQKISINTAPLEKLITVKGISPKLAKLIIKSRNNSGPFLTLDDLRRVKGIGAKKLQKISKYICL